MSDAFIVGSGAGWAEPLMPWFWIPLVVLLAIGGFAIMVVVTSRTGGLMEKANRIRQVYGYTVCLVAVVTGLISTASLVNSAMDMSNPLAAERTFGEASLTSFESFRATRDRFSFARPDAASQPDTASEATLRTRYAALRTDRIAERTFQARKGLISSVILLGLASVLFTMHWRWLRGLPDTGGPTA